ncbi:transglutaminase domain-containing protein [Desulfosporosinus fructosivorans]
MYIAKKKAVLFLLSAIILTFFITSSLFANNSNLSFWDNLLNSYSNINLNTEGKPNALAQDEVLDAILSYQVEQIVKGAKDDQDKAIRIAKWISANISNRGDTGNIYLSYASRIGLCNARAELFVKMLSYQNITAKVFNMYNFGEVGGGHSCDQVYYNEQWHFFDVTYAGIFMKNGNVLSWDEIKSNPQDAINHMVVFDQTLDRYGLINGDTVIGDIVHNLDRMHLTYSADIITNAKSYGFLQSSDIKTLYPTLNFKNNSKQIQIGQIDNSYTDVDSNGVQKSISEDLGTALGNAVDTFHTQWEFENVIPGKKYTIKYYLYKATSPNIQLWAQGKSADVVEGGTYVSSELISQNDRDIWDIQFVPNSTNCSILVGYNFRDPGKLAYVDMIDVGPAN